MRDERAKEKQYFQSLENCSPPKLHILENFIVKCLKGISKTSESETDLFMTSQKRMAKFLFDR